MPIRERIRAIAEDLYVLRGHDGFSFGDIAAAIGTTRANIHHHFGSKRQLMAELIEKFVADAEARIAQNWTREGFGFGARKTAFCSAPAWPRPGGSMPTEPQAGARWCMTVGSWRPIPTPPGSMLVDTAPSG